MRSVAVKCTLFFSFCFAIAHAETIERVPRCSGGDGPHPLADISSEISSDMKVVPTGGGIREFTLTPSIGSVIFRRDNGDVLFRSFSEPSAVKFTTSGLPLDRLVSPESVYFSVKNGPWHFDLYRSRWWNYEFPGTPHHAFWKDDTIYSYDFAPSAEGSLPDVNFYRYTVGQPKALPACSVRNLRIGEGHVFPHAIFYRTRPVAQGTVLSLFHVDIERCQIAKETIFQDPIPGPVEEVHRFENLQATVVKVNHPRSNLLWQSSEHGCHYYDLEGAKALAFTHQKPLLASYSEKGGLKLIDLRREKVATLFPAGQVNGAEKEDLAAHLGEEHLFVSPRIAGSAEGRPLLRIDLSQFNAVQKPSPK